VSKLTKLNSGTLRYYESRTKLIFNELGGHETMSKKLVAYFSASGVTARIANTLANALAADLYEIKPEIPYTQDDLNWLDKTSRTSVEMADKSSRPAITDKNVDIETYDTIFIGFPIWWYVAPTIINTFLESYDFSGKTIILFATSGGSGFGKTIAGLKGSVAADTIIKEGILLNVRESKEALSVWIESLKEKY
jgi:flavodoxin